MYRKPQKLVGERDRGYMSVNYFIYFWFLWEIWYNVGGYELFREFNV